MLQDLRYAVRTLLANPGFTAVAVLALALGIGANSAIFTVVNAILLRPLPYRDAGRLAIVFQAQPSQNWKRLGVSGPNYVDIKEQSRLLEDVALFEPGSGTLTGLGEPEQIAGMRVTPSFFSVLGARPHLGRLFSEAEAAQGFHTAFVITYNFWKNRLGGDPSAIGRKFEVDGLPYTLTGVLAPDFWFPMASEGFAVWPEDVLRRAERGSTEFGVIARMKPGVTVERLNSELRAIFERIAAQNAGQQGWTATALPFREILVEYIRPALLVLFGAVGFVLLIACTNIANLLLARGAARAKEIAIRSALGAGRARVIRQFLTESVVLACMGGVLGLTLAYWATALLTSILPRAVPVPETAAQVALAAITVDRWVLIFTFAVSILTGVIFGIAPALAASRTQAVEALKEGGRASSLSGSHAIRSTLVVVEVALALVLLIGASLMIRSMVKLQRVDPGFRTEQILTLEVELPTDSKYREPNERANVWQRFLASIREQPGLESAALTRAVPLGDEEERTFFEIEGRAPAAANERLGADFRAISPNYFRTLGIPLLRGRAFNDLDRADSARVALVDATFAKRFWPEQDPVGRVIVTPRGRKWQVVGVVGAVRHAGLNRDARPTIYVPYLQYPFGRMSFVIRTASDPESVVQTVKRAIWKVDRGQPVYNVKTMDDLLADSAAAPRLTLVLLGIFAGLALVLAVVGIYGVLSYTVSQRKHELGIRVALGAGAGEILRLVVGRAMLLAAAGVVIGAAAAFALTRLLGTLLYGISATDPLTFAAVAAALIVAALAASYVPARRATRVSPIEALRYE